MCPVHWGTAEGLSSHLEGGKRKITLAALIGFSSGPLTDRAHLSSALRVRAPQLLERFLLCSCVFVLRFETTH